MMQLNVNGIYYGIVEEMNVLIMSPLPTSVFGSSYPLNELQVEPVDIPLNDICESLKVVDKNGNVLFDVKRSDFIENGHELPGLEEYDRFAYEFAHARKNSY